MLQPVVEADGDDDVNDYHDYEDLESNKEEKTPTGKSLSPGEEGDIDINVLMEDVPENADMHLAYATTDGKQDSYDPWHILTL